MAIQKIRPGYEIWLLRGAFFITALFFSFGLIQFRSSAIVTQLLEISGKWRMGITVLTVFAGILWLGVILICTSFSRFLLEGAYNAGNLFKSYKKYNWLVFLVCPFLFSYLAFGPYSEFFATFFTRAFFLWLFSLIGYACLGALWPKRSWPFLIVTSVLVITVVFRIAYFLPGINNYPFSLGWGESSTYVYSSQFLASRLYGSPAPLPMINSGRALLGVIPYLLPSPQIWINRLWAAFLWVALTGLSAFLLSQRLNIQDRLKTFLLILWAFLFIFQGPVYYELLLPVTIVLGFFDARRFWRSLVFVVIASLWAGICRVNWFPMPGMIAVFLYFLEIPIQKASLRQYLLKPTVWASGGLASALASYTLYSAISGNETTFASSSMNSPLLWYRLLPNATDAWGVLPAALLVGLPSIILSGIWLKKYGHEWHFIRKMGILSILLIFFMGGIIVSVKIGGGSGIHNLDAFWFFLLVLSSYLFFNRIPPDLSQQFEGVRVPQLLTASLITIPIIIPLMLSNSPPRLDSQAVNDIIKTLNNYIDSVLKTDKTVLVIDNKQLIPFGYIPRGPMMAQYETVFMLEMAMSGNQEFFEKFRQELKDKRFGLIITYPQPGSFQSSDHAFFEENNVQVKFVGQPLNCYYYEVRTWLNPGVELFLPRSNNDGCN